MTTLLVIVFAALIILAIAGTILTETENFGWTTLIILGSVVLAQWTHAFDFLGFINTHGLLTLKYVLGYVGIGVLWSFVKWFLFLTKFRESFRTIKSDYLKDRNLNPNGQVPQELMVNFSDHVRNKTSWREDYHLEGLSQLQKPSAAKNKARIVAWMSFWPYSFIGTMLNDPMRRLFNFLFTQFKALYQKMSDAMFANDVELK